MEEFIVRSVEDLHAMLRFSRIDGKADRFFYYFDAYFGPRDRGKTGEKRNSSAGGSDGCNVYSRDQAKIFCKTFTS